MASGFHQALCLTRSGPTLNLNLAFASFYLPLNFVEFASKYLRKDITKNLDRYEIDAMTELFENLSSKKQISSFHQKIDDVAFFSSLCLVETIHAGRPLRYRFHGFGRNANQLTFNIGSDDQQLTASAAKSTTVAEYFAQKYSKLKYPHLPCIDARKANEQRTHWLPMEIVRVSSKMFLFVFFSMKNLSI